MPLRLIHPRPNEINGTRYYLRLPEPSCKSWYSVRTTSQESGRDVVVATKIMMESTLLKNCELEPRLLLYRQRPKQKL